MRIAYVIADHGIPVFGDKGAAVHVQEMVRAFGKLGHEVRVLAARVGKSPPSPGMHVCKIRPPPEDGGRDPIADQSSPDNAIRERRNLAIGETMERELCELYAEWRFDLIYERYSLWSAAGVRASEKLDVPCVVEVNAPLLLEQSQYRQLCLVDRATEIEREVFRRAGLLLPVSDGVRDYIVKKGGSPARIRVIPNGVDLDRFKPDVQAARLPGTDGRFVIGFTGSLRPWHGIEILMSVFRRLANEIRDSHLLIVGDGPMRQWIDGFAHGAGLADRVTVTGWQAHADIPSLLNRFDVAVAPYPALDDFYFSPLKLFEYLAAGRAIVASDIGQIRSVIDDGRTGLLARPGDAAELANQIVRLRYDPGLRKMLASAARERAARHSWIGTAEQVIVHSHPLRKPALRAVAS